MFDLDHTPIAALEQAEAQIEDLKLALKSYELELDMADARLDDLTKKLQADERVMKKAIRIIRAAEDRIDELMEAPK